MPRKLSYRGELSYLNEGSGDRTRSKEQKLSNREIMDLNFLEQEKHRLAVEETLRRIDEIKRLRPDNEPYKFKNEFLDFKNNLK